MSAIKQCLCSIGTLLVSAALGVGIAAGWQAPSAPTMFGDYVAKNTPTTPFGGAEKVTENESPLPQDRIFADYNLFVDVPVQGVIVRVHREGFGFEKILPGGRTSIGFRQPAIQIRGSGIEKSEASDQVIVFKYAPILDREHGKTVSIGLVFTLPTSSEHLEILPIAEELVHRAHVLEPFVGYRWQKNELYVHGFTSLEFGTESTTRKILFDSVGVGYWLYHGAAQRPLTDIAATFELHVNTPLSRQTVAGFRSRDAVDLTGGFSFLFKRQFEAGIAVGTTVTHPRLFNVEVIPRLNWHF